MRKQNEGENTIMILTLPPKKYLCESEFLMKNIKHLCIALSILLFLGCNGKSKILNNINDGDRVICRLVGDRIFDVQQTPEEIKTRRVTSYRIISERVTIYADGSCEWSFKYIDDERNHVFNEKLPDNMFASLIDSLKKDKRFKLKDRVFELRYDFSNSSFSGPKISEEIMTFLDEKYKNSNQK